MRVTLLRLFAGVLLACSPRASQTVSAPAPGSALAVPLAPAGGPADGPLRVAHYAPVGETDGQLELQIVFDRPVVALGPDGALGDLLTVTPAVAGEAYWLGTQAIVFRPLHGWPMATEFRAALSPALRASDGQALGEPFAFSFTTPPPAVVRASPYDGARGQEPTRAVDLYFNQRVAADALAAQLDVQVVRGGVAKAHRVQVVRPDADDPKRLRVVPLSPWPRAAEVVLSVRAGLVGEEGPRPLSAPFASRFHTFEALAFADRAPCGGRPDARCSPSDGVVVSFTNPVSLARAARALRFEPPLLRPLDPEEYGDYTSDGMYVYGGLKPLTHYTVQLAQPLSDVHGQRFSGPRTLSFDTGALASEAYLPSTGDIAEANTHAQLPLILQNVQGAQLSLTRLDAEALAVRLSEGADEGEEPKAAAHRGAVVRALPSVGPAESLRTTVDVAPSLDRGRGALLVEVSRGMGDERELLAQRLVAYTDLAPMLKIGATGGAVWVTRLSDASAVAGADVRVLGCRDEELARGTTDADGVLRFQVGASSRCQATALVRHAGDLSFTRQYAGLGPYALTEHADPYEGAELDGLVFTERGVYRPGEDVHVKVIGRRLGSAGLTVPEAVAHLSVSDARGRSVHEAELSLSEFGTADARFSLPLDVALGALDTRVELGGATLTAAAEVAEYRRAELSAELTVRQQRLVSGESADVHVRAAYLFGAAASGQPVTWAARRVSGGVRPPGAQLDGYSFDDARRHFADVRAPDDTEVQSGEAALDGSGELALRIPLSARAPGEPARYEIEATVEGLGGTSASAQGVVAVTPASFLAGVRPATALAAAGEKVDVDVLAVTPDGAPALGAALRVTLERREYREVAELDERGARSTRRKAVDVVVDRCRRVSAVAAQACPLTPDQAGLYFVRVESEDGKGRLTTASAPLYVYGAGAGSFGEGDGQVLTLRTGKPVYRLGETARIVVPSPFREAEALVTVERETVLSTSRHGVRDGTLVLDVPVDARFVPNAFVSVLLVRARSAAEGPAGRPDFRIGVVEIATDSSEHALQVSVRPSSPVAQPGAELDVDVDVKSAAGRPTPAELTLFAVDEGVLALTGYRTPDPFAYFYRARGLSVWTADARAQLVADDETPDALGEKGGAEGGGGGASVRSDFRALAYYAPRVLTDANGRAHVRFKLPDSITRYRVMAVAVGRGADFGAGAADVRTQKPLMLRAALPRVIRAGDVLRAGVAVHNESDSALDVRVRAELSGLQLRGAGEQRVHLDAHSAKEVLYDVEAPRAGAAQLTFRAAAGPHADALTVPRSVLSPTALETVASYGQTDARAIEQLAPLKDVRRDVGGLRLRVSTSELTAVAGAADALTHYPYACTEQLSSRLAGLSALYALSQKKFDTGPVDRGALVQLVAALVKRQRSDGSFVLWPNEESEGPSHFAAFLTAYALRALDIAERAGVADSHATRDAALGFLAGYLRAERDATSTPPDDETRVFVLAALAEAGRVDAAYLATLAERSDGLSLPGKVTLFGVAARARAERLAGADALSQRLLGEIGAGLRQTSSAAHVERQHGDAYASFLDSDVRATAMLLNALLAYDRKHVLVPRLARYLGEAKGRDGTWGNTHDNAWGLDALARYVADVERAEPKFDARVLLGGKTLLSASLSGRGAARELTVPMADLPAEGAAISLEKKGEGRLVHALSLSFARTELPDHGVERGFFVERSYERITPLALLRGPTPSPAVSEVELGDYVRVTLRVAAPAERRFVLIEDALPAGLEPVSAFFTTGSYAAERAIGLATGPYAHRELFDDRVAFAVTTLAPGIYTYSYLARAVTAGRFVAPAAKAEDMYHPETYGATRVEHFTVKGAR